MTFCTSVLLAWLLVQLALKGALTLRAMHIRVPEAVKSGDSVTLACDYDLEEAALYTIKWYRGDEEFYRYVPKESPPSKVFPMPPANVDVSLSNSREVTLRAVQRELTGNYKCEVSADAPLFHTDIREAFMMVAELPNGNPTLRIESPKVEMGDKIRANCSSPGSYPSANITWYINGEKISKDTRYHGHLGETQVHTDPALGLDTSSSWLELTAVAGLFTAGRATLRCEATVYDLYRGADQAEVLEDTPHLAPVMGPTAPHSQEDVVDTLTNGSNVTRTLSRLLIILHFLSLLLTVR